MVSPSLHSDLAPTGKMRVGINYGNPVLTTRDPASGELRGVAIDLARELGRRADLPVELVGYDAAGKMVEGLKAGAWDIAFLAVDPGRENAISFTPPYIEIEGSYLVPSGSPLRAIADVDRKGVRIALAAGAAYELFLSRNIKHAQLVRVPDPKAAFELLVAGKVEALAGVRQTLVTNAGKLPGSRVLDGRWGLERLAMAFPKGRGAGMEYVNAFVADIKASGLVARAAEKVGLRGAVDGE